MNTQINTKNFTYSELIAIRIGLEITQKVFSQRFGNDLLEKVKELQFGLIDNYVELAEKNPNADFVDEIFNVNQDFLKSVHEDVERNWVKRSVARKAIAA